MGPWVYRTQSAMIQSFQNIGSLRRNVERIGILQLMYLAVTTVLEWNFLFFLRVINFVSRRKEFRADELACLVAGKEPMIEGLRKIHGGAIAWPTYWNTEVAPVLQLGCIPPIGDGLARFLAAPQIAEQGACGLKKELAEVKTNPYDTHPSLRDRIAAMETVAAESREQSGESALTLLGDPLTAERRWIDSVNPGQPKGTLRRVSWDEVGPMVMIPAWKASLGEYAALLEGITAESLAETAKNLGAIGPSIRDPKGMLLTPEQRKQSAGRLLGVALGLALLERGWQLEAQPGNFRLYRGSEKLDVFGMIQELAFGKVAQEAWRERCRELGIAGATLGTVGPEASGPQREQE